ncbi:protein kinase [Granulicella sp. WH15]|uniref:serine/threonine-protein kinase n=1 Tax=Granulicella sp. WH15 TaxID=2602070 RepID=UPI001366FFAF|nr:serine/threonine-protein kinase [Granulicella sp. WH15]QHN03516.1 protein kinase [Granulicella sp. WH15]
MIPVVGQRFGPFEILARLDHPVQREGSGTDALFRARDNRSQHEVALRILGGGHTATEMREVRAAAALHHPNICAILDIGELDGEIYLAMELLEGESLMDRIARGPIRPDELVAIAKEVADALGAAHSKGIVHRELKPSNIFLTTMQGLPQAKVLGFGVTQAGKSARVQGKAPETLYYISPEQARGEVLDSRSDLFSLGAVMYEMATRQIPFSGDTSASVFVKLLNHAPEPIREWSEAPLSDLAEIIQRLLAKDRMARFQTAQELREALEKLDSTPCDKISNKSSAKSGSSWLRKAVAAVPRVRTPREAPAQDRPLPPDTRGSIFSNTGEKTYSTRPGWVRWTVASVLAVLAAVGLLLLKRGHFRTAILTTHDAVVLTVIENHTGDAAFDDSIATALHMALEQSPYLRLQSSDDYRLALRELGGEDTTGLGTARLIAHRLGAKAYLYGSIARAGEPYTVHVDLRETSTDKLLCSAEQVAPNRQQIASTVDLLSDSLRAEIGEDGDSIDRTHVPLAQEATGNLEALHQFALGESLLSSGHMGHALGAYQQAATLDPKFTQPELRLATFYQIENAETAAEDAARKALISSANAGDQTRLMAQYTYEMNTSFNYARATEIVRQLLQQYPQSIDALTALSRVQRLQGRLPEALETAQETLIADPRNVDAYFQMELALISLDRYDAALHVQSQLDRLLGVAATNHGLIAAYLSGRQDRVEQYIEHPKSTHDLSPQLWEYGLYLDNAGQMAAGAAVWSDGAKEAQSDPYMLSVAPSLLAQGALDRALAGECPSALKMAGESSLQLQGHDTLFHAGMASALCGDTAGAQRAMTTLTRRYPQSTAVGEYYIPDLKGALALERGDPAAAIEYLKPARPFDILSLTPLLRGRAHVALHQEELGIVDYQTVLSHRGLSFTIGSNVYPMAQIGVARAFAASGDTANSAAAYKSFEELWKDADPTDPLLIEAHHGMNADPTTTTKPDTDKNGSKHG